MHQQHTGSSGYFAIGWLIVLQPQVLIRPVTGMLQSVLFAARLITTPFIFNYYSLPNLPRTMFPLLRLPNDIIHIIADQFDRDISSFNSLSRTNRRFSSLLTSRLNHLAVRNPTLLKDSPNALICATKHANLALATLALSESPHLIAARDNLNRTALHWAILTEHTSEPVIKLLLHHGAVVNALCLSNGTPLHYTALHGRATAARVLLENGVDPNYFRDWPSGFVTPLFWAVKHGRLEIIKILLEHGAEIPVGKDDRGATVVHWATRYTHVLEFLLEKGVGDAESTDFRGDTPLHWAAECGNVATVEILLARGVCTETCNGVYGLGFRPLDVAICNKQQQVIKALLNHGVDMASIGRDGHTAFHLAAEYGDTAVVGILLDYGADIDILTGLEQTALHLVAIGGDDNMVRYLLGRGADINIQDVKGMTALHCAVLRGRDVVIKTLLGHGANLTIEDDKGRTVLKLNPSPWRMTKAMEEAWKIMDKQYYGDLMPYAAPLVQDKHEAPNR